MRRPPLAYTFLAGLIAFVVVVFLPAGLAHAATTYSLQVLPDLGFSGHNQHRANDINEQGDIVGAVEANPPACCTGPLRAVLWHRGVATDLGTLAGKSAQVDSEATAINSAGVVVGWSDTEKSGRQAFRWTATTGMQAMWPGVASDINSSGDIAGTKDGKAVVWTHGRLIDLGAGVGSQPLRINDAGIVVGTTSTTSGERAFQWSRRTGFRILWSGTATDINSSGDIAGTKDGKAVVWTHGRLIDLGAGVGSQPLGISSHGDVVGSRSGQDPYNTVPFLWQHGTLTLLPTRPINGVANAINGSGIIVGAVGFNTRAVSWTPVTGT